MKKLLCAFLISSFMLASLQARVGLCQCTSRFNYVFLPSEATYVWGSDDNGNCCTPQTGAAWRETYVYGQYNTWFEEAYTDISEAQFYCC